MPTWAKIVLAVIGIILAIKALILVVWAGAIGIATLAEVFKSKPKTV